MWVAACALAIGSSLAVVPGALNRYTLGPLVFIGIAALVSTQVVARGSLPRWMPILVLSGALVLLIAALSSDQPLPAILGRWPRYEGLIAVGGYALALILGARLFGHLRAAREVATVHVIISLLAGVHALVSLLDAWGIRLLPGTLDRSGALLGNATDQGMMGAAIAVLLARSALPAASSTRVSAIIARFGVAAALVMVMTSGSRSALIALVVGLVLLALMEFTTARRRVHSAILAAASGAIVLMSLVVPSIAPRILGTSPLADRTITDRLLIWQDSLAAFMNNPVLGVGPNGFLDAVAVVHGPAWFISVSPGTVLDSPHSVPLQVLLAGGPLAVLIAIALIAFTTRAAVVRLRNESTNSAMGIVAAIVTLALGLMVNPSSVSVVITLALLVGALVAEPVKTAPSRRRRTAFTVIVASWMILVATTLAAEVALGVGGAAPDEVQADAAFGVAFALRPWDVDTPAIAAEVLTARVDSGDIDDPEIARRWAELALAVAPQSLSAARATITVSLATGDLQRASDVVTEFRRIAPRDPWFAHRAGVVALLEGDESAEGELLEATELNPSWSAPWETLAYLYEQQGRSVDAENALSEAHLRADSRP